MDQITIKKRPRSEAVITQRKFFKKTARGKVIKGDHVARRSTLYLIIHQYFVNAIFVMMFRVEYGAASRAILLWSTPFLPLEHLTQVFLMVISFYPTQTYFSLR